jgi:hypothetical protein
MTGQVRMSEKNGLEAVIRPHFQTFGATRSSLNLPGIPGNGL